MAKVINPILVYFTPEAFEKTGQAVHTTKICYGDVALSDTKAMDCIIKAILNKQKVVLIEEKDV